MLKYFIRSAGIFVPLWLSFRAGMDFAVHKDVRPNISLPQSFAKYVLPNMESANKDDV